MRRCREKRIRRAGESHQKKPDWVPEDWMSAFRALVDTTNLTDVCVLSGLSRPFPA